jgi:hypothetical protein
MKNGKSSKNSLNVSVNNTFGLAMHKKISKGLSLSFKKLVKEKRMSNSVLAFYENEKIITVKAKDIKL